MRVCKKIILFTVLLSFAANATPIQFGTTNFSEPWQGGNLQGTIDWAVYETADYTSDMGFDAPDPASDFVYIYQVNNALDSDYGVSYFSILGVDETNTSGQTYEDYAGGVEPGEQYLDETEGAVWKWLPSANGYIIQDDHSWLLVLSSNYGPVVRDYVIKGPDEGDPLQGPDQNPEIPEPATIAMLGFGGAYLLRRKRRV
jgi:hypothetical protein